MLILKLKHYLLDIVKLKENNILGDISSVLLS